LGLHTGCANPLLNFISFDNSHWTDSSDILASTAFDADPETGLGAWPNASTNFEVRTGAFSNFVRTYPTVHQIIRNYTVQPYLDPGVKFPFNYSDPELFANETQTPENWKQIVEGNAGNFTGFQLSVDGHRLQGMHPSTHVSSGGPEGWVWTPNFYHIYSQGWRIHTFSSFFSDVTNLATSPSDPIFYLLHGNLDRLWWQWQTNDPRNMYAIAGGETQDLVNVDLFPTGTGTPVTGNTTLFMCGLAPDRKISEVFDIMSPLLCYRYDWEGGAWSGGISRLVRYLFGLWLVSL
jgi:tyrosinase